MINSFLFFSFFFFSFSHSFFSQKYGRTPLFLASQKGQSDMVQLLLNSKTNINTITRKIKCRFETDIVKIPCKKTTTFQEFITMVEDEWGGEKGIRYRDEEGDMVTMKRTEELVWVWEKSGSESVRVEVFSKGSQGVCCFFLIFFDFFFDFFF